LAPSTKEIPTAGGRCAANKTCAMHSASLATSLIPIEAAKKRLVRQAGHAVISPFWAGRGHQTGIYNKATVSIRRLGLCRLSWSPAQAPRLCIEAPFADLSTHFGARGLATDLSTRPRHSSTRANIGRKVPRCVAGTSYMEILSDSQQDEMLDVQAAPAPLTTADRAGRWG
jgi:hypothetical protein